MIRVNFAGRLAALCIVGATASCGAADQGEATETDVDDLSSALAPASSILTIAISPGTETSPGVWTAPTNTSRTTTMHIEDSGGTPAPSGLVTVQFCAAEGQLALREACVRGGGGRWESSILLDVNSSGDASFTMSTPPTLPYGLRFKYAGRGSGFKNATSAAINVLPET